MGGAIGTQLAETGCDLVLFDLDVEAVARMVAKGAGQGPRRRKRRGREYAVDRHVFDRPACHEGSGRRGCRPGGVAGSRRPSPARRPRPCLES